MTSYSRYPRMMAAAGLPLADVIDRLVSHDPARQEAMNSDFVFVDEFVPGIRWDAKYATWDNFTGKPVDGYLPIASSAPEPCAPPWTERRKKPHPWASACSSGTVTARNAPSTASCAGRGSRRTAARSGGTTRTSTGRDVRTGVRGRQVGPQPGQHRRPDALPAGHRRPCPHGRRPRPDGLGLPSWRTRNHVSRSGKPAPPLLHHGGLRLRFATTANGGTTPSDTSPTQTPTSISPSHSRADPNEFVAALKTILKVLQT